MWCRLVYVHLLLAPMPHALDCVTDVSEQISEGKQYLRCIVASVVEELEAGNRPIKVSRACHPVTEL